ncbi:MAG: dethiobiotin synthase [Deltaproteobacteria bacterium]|nr:dethiobiotin synthase [Deltaproteobacteria bacterium]
MRGLFVTGTDTGVGKTAVSCAIAAHARAHGVALAVMKPAETGCTDTAPEDALALRDAAGSTDPLELVCPYRLPEPLAPAVAARRAGRTLSISHVVDCARKLGEARPLLVEGAGGLLVPFTERETNADLIGALGLPVLVVARAGLGTINHTALTVEALRARKLEIRAVVLNATSEPDLSAQDNAREIARLTGSQVFGPLAFVSDPRARRDQLFRFAGGKIDPLIWLA